MVRMTTKRIWKYMKKLEPGENVEEAVSVDETAETEDGAEE